ncbi:signal recognition particle-docking protein FtsY [Mediannikoviicoccus vaginalis]|uniref:signal recognition particle-docking protein FtsY n=1 Tax=Mediannikoviicoccus vaginalis TaxID=2899727 RepID=UPI001EFFA4AE|nr:signal recognition particle-docking protein FtsY [Mediannikoviicoccus vaginalis]
MLESFFNKFKKKDKEEPGIKEKIEETKESVEKDLEDIKEESKDIQENIDHLKDSIEENLNSTEEKEDIDNESRVKDLNSAEEKEVEEVVETEEVQEVKTEEKKGFFNNLFSGLQKTRDNISNKIDSALARYQKVDEELFEELEEILISADIGVESTMNIMDELEDQVKLKRVKDPKEVKSMLMNIMIEKLEEANLDNSMNIKDTPLIMLVIGVNGVGKTTTIGKLASKYKNEGKSVTLVAADTFRAAAIEQLNEWSNRAGVDIISHQEGADPASVVFDGIASAKSKNTDILICDTAGRLHNKKNLMNELEKIHRIVDREYPDARKEVLLVVDGTTGQNAILQVKQFKEVADITGVVITKLDGTAKGGMVFPIESEFNIPIKYIGVGEQIDQLMEFNPKDFISAIFN